MNSLGFAYNALGKEAEELSAIQSKKSRVQSGMPLYLKARKYFESAIAVIGSESGQDCDECLQISANLGVLLCDMRDYPAAERLLRSDRIRCEDRLGRDHPRTARAYNNLALLLADHINLREARELYQNAVSIQCDTLGSSHPDTLLTLNNLALLYQVSASEGMAGGYRRSTLLWLDALRMAKEHLGSHHPLSRMMRKHLAANVRDVVMRMGTAGLLQAGAFTLGVLSKWLWGIGVPMVLAGVVLQFREVSHWCSRSPLDQRNDNCKETGPDNGRAAPRTRGL